MYVREWMSSPALTLPGDTPALDALEFMRVKKIRRVPVMRGGAIEGILTLSDLLAAFGPSVDYARRNQVQLSDVMAHPVVTVTPDDTLEHASKIMLENEISGLPVLHIGRLCGVITESDIFRAFNRVMGVSEPGVRVVISVPETGDLLTAIRARLGTLAIRNLVAYQQAESTGWEVVMRLRGRVAHEPEPEPV